MAACAALTAPRLQACKGATAEFARISTAIRAVEDELKADGGDAGLAAWVRKLQQAEQSKLQLTVGMQVTARLSARARAALRKASGQGGHGARCGNSSAFAPGTGSHADSDVPSADTLRVVVGVCGTACRTHASSNACGVGVRLAQQFVASECHRTHRVLCLWRCFGVTATVERRAADAVLRAQVERKRLAGVHEAVDLVGKAAGLPAVERRLSLNFSPRVLGAGCSGHGGTDRATCLDPAGAWTWQWRTHMPLGAKAEGDARARRSRRSWRSLSKR